MLETGAKRLTIGGLSTYEGQQPRRVPSRTERFQRYVCRPVIAHASASRQGFRAELGDYIFVPPYDPHREENPDTDNSAVIVIARSTQEAIVVNLPALDALSDQPK
jgi:hypothetical protein